MKQDTQQASIVQPMRICLSLLLMALSTFLPARAHEDHTLPPGQGQTESAETLFIQNAHQLILSGNRSGEGYFSQDGQTMIFQSEREPGNPFFQMYQLDLTTGDIERLSPGQGKTTCGWLHPDGQHRMFASTHADPAAKTKQQDELQARQAGKTRRYSWDYDEHYDIYESAPQQPLKNLTHTQGYDAEGAYSPDGKWIVFASNRQAYQRKLNPDEQKRLQQDAAYFMDIYLMSRDGTQIKQLTTSAGYDGGPFFSPDGQRIVWRRFSSDGVTAEIHTMQIDGSDVQQITRLGNMSWAPFYHPSGQYLIFSTNKHGFDNFELYLVDTAGKKDPVRVTYTPGFDGLPVFSPDGQSLSWTSNRTPDHKSQIFMAHWNHVAALKALGLPPATPAKSGKAAQAMTTAAAITSQDLKVHVTQLASETMEGRLTGTPGERKAMEYVASHFKSLGLPPAGDKGTYFQAFEFTSGAVLGKNNQLSSHQQPLVINQDWRPLVFSRSGKVEPSEVVFAGYGLVAPAEGTYAAYDSYVHLDVKDKWVMVLRYWPDQVDSAYRLHLARYGSLRYKAMLARDKGAKGLIIVNGPLSQVKEQLIPLTFDASSGGTSLAVISVTDDLAQKWLTARNLQTLQTELNTGKPMSGFILPALKLGGNLDVVYQKAIGQNVIARLGPSHQPASQSVMIGAHGDHLGRGTGSSLARAEEKGQIHFGADDNASGVAGVLEIAEYLSGLQKQGKLSLKKDIYFAIWSGEELGLIGSNAYVQNHLPPGLSAYLNMDMIGRLQQSLILQGMGSSSVWTQEVEKANVVVGLPVVLQTISYLPTDATAFYLKNIPILNAFTGAHSDYHTPRDTADKLNYDGAEKVARLMAGVTRSLALSETKPDYKAMEKPTNASSRGGLRVYLGTIPDYAQELKGVKLSGVVKGGPAEKAGLQAEDVIVELAGKKIENIYDYTFALDQLRVGETAEITIIRQGQQMKLKITPGSRD